MCDHSSVVEILDVIEDCTEPIPLYRAYLICEVCGKLLDESIKS